MFLMIPVLVFRVNAIYCNLNSPFDPHYEEGYQNSSSGSTRNYYHSLVQGFQGISL